MNAPAGPGRPLSYPQERQWLLERLRPGDPALLATIALELCGPLDEAALRTAATRLIERHPMLRTTVDASTEPASLRPIEPADAAAASLSFDVPAAGQPFDLEREPPWRVRLLRCAPHRHELHLTVHQIACDGTSAGILVRDLAEMYAASVESRPVRLPPPGADPTLVGVAERRLLTDRVLAERQRWARERLTGAARLALPTAPPGRNRSVSTFGGDLDGTDLAAVRAAARRAGATAFVVWYTALSLVLAEYTGNPAPLVFAAVSGRDRPALAETVGFFTHLVPLRTALAADTRAAAVREHRATVLDALTRLLLPPATLAQTASAAMGGNPFQVLLTHAVPAPVPATAGGLRWRRLPAAEPEWFELHLFVSEGPDNTRLLLRCRDDVHTGHLSSIWWALRRTLRALGEHPTGSAIGAASPLAGSVRPPAGTAAARAAAGEAVESPPGSGPMSPAAAAMARVLGRTEIAETADFTALGGSSLLVPLLAVELERRFGVVFPLDRLAGTPLTPSTVDALATSLRSVPAAQAPIRPAAERLDPSVRPDPGRWRTAGRRPAGGRRTPVRRLLLTGATGYLGAHVLRAMLDRHDVDVVCLVRGGGDPAAARVSATLERLCLPTDALDRVRVLAGDLAAPLVGLGRDRFAITAEEIDTVVHCGAWVNFVYPYQTLRPVNVGGTQEVLRLAARAGAAVHLVSTAGVMADPPAVAEPPPDTGAAADTGYVTSKRIAEGFAREAARRGLPVSVIRPGWLAGNPVTGTCRRRDFVWSLLAGCAQVGIAPDVEFPLELTMVDEAAEAVARIVDGELTGPLNLPVSYRTDFATLVDVMRRNGHHIEAVPLYTWRHAIVAAIVDGRAGALAGFLSVLPTWSPLPLPVLDTARVRTLLDPPAARPLDALIPRWLAYAAAP